MGFEKYSTAQLKKANRWLLTISVLGLVGLCFALGMGLYAVSKDEDSPLLFLVPTVFGPLVIFPALLATVIGGEVKRREKNIP